MVSGFSFLGASRRFNRFNGTANLLALSTMTTMMLAAFVLASPKAVQAQNLFVNPNFSLGNTGFSTGYTYFPPPMSPLPEGRYALETSPRSQHPLQADFPDHTGDAAGLMMVVNGGTLSNVYDYPVWQETVTVMPNTNYEFGVWTTTADSIDSSPAQLVFRVNGSNVAPTFTVQNPGGVWRQFIATWNSGQNTTSTWQVFDINTNSSGNDFVLDDFSLRATATGAPEPGTIALIASLALPIAGFRLRRKRNR